MLIGLFKWVLKTVSQSIDILLRIQTFNTGGFISHMSDVATRMCWENRQHPNIVRLFQILLQQDDLWVKLDRYGFMRPTKGIPFKNKDNNSITIEDRPEWRSKPNW